MGTRNRGPWQPYAEAAPQEAAVEVPVEATPVAVVEPAPKGNPEQIAAAFDDLSAAIAKLRAALTAEG